MPAPIVLLARGLKSIPRAMLPALALVALATPSRAVAQSLAFFDALSGPSSPNLNIDTGSYSYLATGPAPNLFPGLQRSSIAGPYRPMNSTVSGAYLTANKFTAELTVRLAAGDLLYFGLGQGDTDPYYSEPAHGFNFRVHNGFGGIQQIQADVIGSFAVGNSFYQAINTIGSYTDGSTITLRIARSGDSVTLSVVGGGSVTYSLSQYNGALGLTPANTHLYFGNTVAGSVFTDLKVTEPNSIDFAVPQRLPWVGRYSFGHIAHRTGPLDAIASDDGGPYSGSNPTIWVYTNDGSGNFTMTDQFKAQVGPTAIIQQSLLIDVNNDGLDDIVTCGNGAISIYLNTNGRFTTPPITYSEGGTTGNAYFPGSFGTFRIAAARTSPSGNVDLAVAGSGNGGKNKVLVFHGNGDGTFAANPVTLITGYYPYPGFVLKFIDFDGHGYPAIVTGGGDNNGAEVFRNNGDGTYTETTYAHPDYYQDDVVAVDMDNDGVLDLVISSFSPPQPSRIVWYKGLGNASFDLTTMHVAYAGMGGYVDPHGPTWYDNHVPYATVSTADFDGDGLVDLIGSYQTGRPAILRNNGDGTFTQVWQSARNATDGQFAVAQFMYFVDTTGTGQPTLFGANYRNNSTQVQTPWGLNYGPSLATPKDTTPPVITVPADITAEATSPAGAVVTFAATAVDDVDGPVPVLAVPASGTTFPIGTTTADVEAADKAGNIAHASFNVTVRDTTPPTITSVTPSVATLWPPNHQMVPVTVAVTATDNTHVASVKIVSVTSSEPDNGLGDGDMPNDIQITGVLTVSLRAERSGTGSGRTYTITVEATDDYGNSSRSTCTVFVPKSQGKGK